MRLVRPQFGINFQNPNADLNSDNYINFLDAIILGSNFGQTDP